METLQNKLWTGQFGKSYTLRNAYTHDKWNEYYLQMYGQTKLELNRRFLADLQLNSKILEVGCNKGLQLEGFQKQGFSNLYGIDIQKEAIDSANKSQKDIQFLWGNANDIPFKENYFDMVCTHGLLIHISPENLITVLEEIYRCSRRFIFGFEYYHNELLPLDYRGRDNYLWKGDYCQLFLDHFPKLQLVKKELISYISPEEVGNKDCMYLLEIKD